MDDRTVESGGTGQQPSLAVAGNGVIGVTYFGTSGTSGEPCTEADGGGRPQDNMDTPIRNVPVAIGLPNHTRTTSGWHAGRRKPRLDADHTPHVATMTGEPIELLRYCGANDVGLLTRTPMLGP